MCLSLQLFPSVAQENPQCLFKIKWMQIFQNCSQSVIENIKCVLFDTFLSPIFLKITA